MNCSRVLTWSSWTYFNGCWESKYASSSSLFSFSCAALANLAFWLKWSWCNFSILEFTFTLASSPRLSRWLWATDYEKGELKRKKWTYLVVDFVKSGSIAEHFVDFILFPMVFGCVLLYSLVVCSVISTTWWSFLLWLFSGSHWAWCINFRAYWSVLRLWCWINTLSNRNDLLLIQTNILINIHLFFVWLKFKRIDLCLFVDQIL